MICVTEAGDIQVTGNATRATACVPADTTRAAVEEAAEELSPSIHGRWTAIDAAACERCPDGRTHWVLVVEVPE